MERSWLVGSDETQFDLLCWSIERLELVSSLPILVGMIGSWPKAKLDRILEKKTVAGVLHVENSGSGWFQKPSLLLSALEGCTRAVVWLDNDIEIKKPIDDIFDLIEGDKLLMALDHYACNLYKGFVTYNSGVVGACLSGVVPVPPEVLVYWANSCIHPTLRGDQEVLAGMLARLEWDSRIKLLPKKYNYLRLDPEANVPLPDDLRAIHWTGHIGKAHIRKRLMGAR